MFSCDVCKKKFSSGQQLGGHRGSHTRDGTAAPVPGPPTTHVCLLCNESFSDGNKFGGHSKSCRIPFDSLKTDGSRKSRLLKEFGNQCQICGLTEWLGKPAPIELDHIDGNCENNLKTNLRLICPNCQSQTDTFCGKNMGRGYVSERYTRRRMS